MIWLNSLYIPNVVNIHKKIHPGMFIIFQPVLGFLTFYYLTHGVNKLGNPGVLGQWYLRSRQYKFLYLLICLFCLAQLPLLIIFSSLFSYLGDLSCGRETELSWVKINTLRVSVAVVKDMPKPDDWMARELTNNVCDFVETNKKIFLQYEAESALSIPVKESSESAVVILPPLRSITNILMNRKAKYPQLKQGASLSPKKQYNAIVNFLMRWKYGIKASSITDYEMFLKRIADLFWEIDPNYSRFTSRGNRFQNWLNNFLILTNFPVMAMPLSQFLPCHRAYLYW